MTAKERVRCVLGGGIPDRFPVSIWISHKAADKYKAEFQISDECFNQMVDTHIICQPPKYTAPIKEGDATADYYDEWKVGFSYPFKDKDSDEAAIDTSHPIENIDDIEKYIMPSPDDYSFENIENIVESQGADYFILANQANGTLFSKTRYLRGFENILIDLTMNERKIERLLDMITEFQMEMAKKFIAAGVDGLSTGDDVAGQNGLMFSPDQWRRLIKPRQRKINSLYKESGLYVSHHCCGHCFDIIEDYIDIGVDCLNPIQPEAMNLNDLIDKFKGRIAFYGGVSVQKVLPFGTPGDVDKEVERVIRTLGRHNRYIVSASHTIESNVPSENIDSFFKAVKKYNV